MPHVALIGPTEREVERSGITNPVTVSHWELGGPPGMCPALKSLTWLSGPGLYISPTKTSGLKGTLETRSSTLGTSSYEKELGCPSLSYAVTK